MISSLLTAISFNHDEVIGDKVRYTRNGKVYYRALPGKGKKREKKGRSKKAQLLGFGNKTFRNITPSNYHLYKQEVIETAPKLANVENLNQAENVIRNIESFEAVVIVDSRTGEPISAAFGDANSCPIPESARHNVITHNHPTWQYPPDDPRLVGRSLSYADLEAAHYFNSAEMRAVAPGATYSLKPSPAKGWGSSRKLRRVYEEKAIEVHKEHSRKIIKGEMTAAEAEQAFQGEIVRRTAKEMDYRYTERKQALSFEDKQKAKKAIAKWGKRDLSYANSEQLVKALRQEREQKSWF